MTTMALHPEGDSGAANLQWLCHSVLTDVFGETGRLNVDARFYPYIGLTHTIRRQGALWRVRISDHCRCAPRPVIEAIVRILACKVLHRRPPKKFAEIYARYRNDPVVSGTVDARRRQKGKKHFAGHAGRHHALSALYQEVNRQYFNNQIEIRKIGWGVRTSRARLGHYDPVHHTITISPILDSSAVPVYVLKFIVYHEMLHAVFEGIECHTAHKHHPPEFRRAEKSHPDFEAAKSFLRGFCRRH